MASVETNLDDDPLVTGTHKGADGATDLYDPAGIFQISGIIVGLAIYKDAVDEATNLTDGDGNEITDADGNAISVGGVIGDENGLVTAVTETTVSASGITSWQNGDTYNVYKTATKDSVISKIGIDKSRGWKYTDKRDLTSFGWRPEDVDLDKDSDGNSVPNRETPFGPGQPTISKRVR